MLPTAIHPALEVARLPAFRRLWLASVAISLAQWLERVAAGWFVLEETGSPLLAALTWAARMAPNLIVGPIGGAIADRVSRRRLLLTTTLARAALLGALALAVGAGLGAVWVVLVVAALAGSLRMAELTAEQALVVDLVGIERAPAGVGVHSIGVRAIGVVGALLAGVLIDRWGSAEAFAASAGALVLAAALLLWLREPAPRLHAEEAMTPRKTIASDVVEGVRALLSRRPVVGLLVLAVLVEILGFAYNSLLPALARDSLGLGASGLGGLTFAAGLGGLLGAVVLAVVPAAGAARWLLAVVATFGLLLLGVAGSGFVPLTALALVGVGAAAAMFDGLQWALLQLRVDERLRSRALGGWVWAIGWGWVGPVLLGAIAEAGGARLAFAVAGVSLLIIALAAAVAGRTARLEPRRAAA